MIKAMLASAPIYPEAPENSPHHGHIALTGNPTEMMVMWTSALADTPKVRWGTTSKEYTNVCQGTSHTYKASDMCGPPANITAQSKFRDPGWLHECLLTGLEVGTSYYYVFGSESAWSEERTLTTSPPIGPDVGVRLAAFADMGADPSPRGSGTIDRVNDNVDKYNVALHFGDISYAFGNGFVWEQWFRMIERVASRVPYMVSLGNHEYDHMYGADKDPSGAGLGFHPSWGNYGDDSRGECAVPMVNRFHMPESGFGLFWYSFDIGNVHVLQMSTEHDYSPGSKQYEWMAQDLKSVDRTKTPFVILTGHRCPCTTARIARSTILKSPTGPWRSI